MNHLMAKNFASFPICFVALAVLFPIREAAVPRHLTTAFNRSVFPTDFIFGCASAAYQNEGAAHTYGKGPSIWDTFVKLPGKIIDNTTADVADDVYHLYKDDIKLMKEIGLDSFRFSISWSRLLPKGKLCGGVNQEGVKFYNNFINELLANGIKPFVTLFHFDTPQALEDEYGGFLSPKIVDDYQGYADLCFKLFGDRVKHWLTLNEPSTFVVYGYDNGDAAPGRCSNYIGNCTAGDSATEPYIVAHHLLLSHASAVKLYREKYQATQMGQIGITLVTFLFKPLTEKAEDKEAAQRMQDFLFGWFANPITYGDYPTIMHSLVGNRLPNFTESQSEMLKGSMDFLGFNYYSARYASKSKTTYHANQSYIRDSQVNVTVEKNGRLIGDKTGIRWIYVYPQGFQEILLYIKNHYKNPLIYITENGMPDKDNGTLSMKDALKDFSRINYIGEHLTSLLGAIEKGVRVKGYYVWTLTDNFEWDSGFTTRFGLVYVDFKHKLKRYLKNSAAWYKRFLLH